MDLSLAESYIYGTATIHDKSYLINIQQATDQLVVLPADFFNVEGSSQALVSFGLSMDSKSNKIENVSSFTKAFNIPLGTITISRHVLLY